MNERIKQLMGQTLDEKFAGTWSVMDLEDLTKFADRFAELIVKECAGSYSKIDNGNLHMGTDDYLEALHKTFRS